MIPIGRSRTTAEISEFDPVMFDDFDSRAVFQDLPEPEMPLPEADYDMPDTGRDEPVDFDDSGYDADVFFD